MSHPDAALREAGWTGADGRLRADHGLLLVGDIGGTKMLSALCDLGGTVLQTMREPTTREGAPALVAQVVAQRDALLARTGRQAEAIVAAGLGLPASIEPGTGRIHRGPNIPGLEEGDIGADLGRALGVPLALENDANMAALGEAWAGEGRGRDVVVHIAIGTGIGMGIVVDGRLLRGATGAAGEIAFLPLGADPEDPATHVSGPLEHCISSEALMRLYRASGGQGASLRDAFAAPEAALDAVLDRLGTLVARGIQSVAAILDPGAIILGGSLGARPEVLAAVEAALARGMARPPRCAISPLGDRAALVGAARAARRALASALE
ncbi:ROK family protein [Wenxinia marina]|uniref:Transcriptional regulator/sugar kinase n=1 Tax=Wenxinia marina DSM 24838 TaxID=1123501 RepID=A0A0D0PZJ3_9RHOB|nr:ROK family protein [Wenxinia marina]KIQ67774.1 Transcriptional regulator/sugar kinase [Wenxinia marina DSM 24838]